MIENLFTFVRTLGNQRIQGKKFFVTQVGLLGTVSDNSGSIGTAGKVLSSTGSGVSWITVGSGNSNVATLNDLTDVVISTAAEGNLLRFNGTSWVNWAPNFLTGYGSLNDLSDVTLTTPVNGARLVYSSTTSQWIDAAPLAFGKMYYGTAISGDAATTTVITNGTKLSIGTGAFSTNLNIGQVDITTGIAGQGSIHIGAIQNGSTYLLASNNKIQVGSQTEMIAPGDPGDEPTPIFTFTPSTLNIQPLGGDTVFGGYTTATGYKTPAGNRQELLTAAGTKTLTNSASNGQILRWIQPVGGVGNWQADDENTASTPNLDAVTDVGSTTTNSITVGGLSTSGTVTASVVATPLIEREGVLTINSEEQVDQGDPNPNLLYVSWLGDNKFVINADGYAIATTGYKVVGGTASGFLKANGTIDTSTYLTSYTETQTLDAVTDLGSTTTNRITVGGVTVSAGGDVITPAIYSPLLWTTSGGIRLMADEVGSLQPTPGDPANPVIYFDWMEDNLGFVDTDGKITFNGFKTPTGTSAGFLKANGTVDTSAYITGISYLNDIGDVVISTPAAGEVLTFSSSGWVNAPLPDYVSKVQHLVKAGVAITKGRAVYVTSANGTNIIVGLASNATEATSSKTMGLAVSTAAINGHIFIVTEGLIDDLDTSTASAGDPVWLGVNGNLIFGLTNKPVAPAHLVYIGVVTRSHNRNGEIFVHIQNGFELNELHDVLITGTITGQLIRRDGDGLWKNWTPNFLTENSVDVLTNKRINLSTSIASIVNIDSIDSLLGQTDIIIYQDGIDRGGRINVDLEGIVSISNAGIGYYTGQAQVIAQAPPEGEPAPVGEGETATGPIKFYVTVSGNTLTGTVAEFNEAITDGNLVTEAYVGTQIANLVDSAPATLDTLNELAAALGDDPNFATTVATSIGTKQNQLNGTGFVKASGTTISYDNSVYLTSESDPVFTASPAYGIAESNITKWDTAYLWGDHSTFGYLTSLPAHNHDDRYYTETEVNSLLSGKVSTDNFKVLGSGINYDVDRTLKIENGLAIYGAYIGGENSPYTYDIAAQFAFGSRAFEFSADWINEDGANLKLRTLRDCCTNWSPWVEVITSYNISSYALTSLPAHNHTIAEVTSLQTALDGKVPTTRTLTINGTAFDLSADRSWTIGSADGYISDVTLSESGTLKFAGQGSAFTGDIDLSTLPFQPIGTYLTAEADTFASVTGRGNSTDTALYLAGGSGGVPALHIRSGGSSWSEGLAIHPSTDSGYGLTFYRTRAAYTDQTNTWAIGNLGDGNALNHFGLLRKGLTGGVADRAGDAIFTINPTGAFKFGFNPYVGGNIIWHAGNDGDGSGLDADSVDGVHASNIVWGNARGTNDSVTTDADGLDKTGFYTSSGFVTRPEGVEWMYIQHIKLYNDNSQYQKQIGYDTYDDSMWVRTKSANNWSTWKPILTSENIGSYALTSLPAHTHTIANVTGLQTALDGKLSAEADTLDTVLSRGASTTRTAEFYQTSNTFVNTVSAGNRGLTVYQDTAGADAYMTFHIGGDYAGYFGLGGAENDLVWGGWSVGNARHRILHSGNFTNNSADWNAAYDWGNHAIAGYLTSLPAHSHIIGDVTGLQTALDGKLSTSGKAADSELIDGIDSSSILWGNARGTNDSVTTDADGLDKTGFYTSSGFVTRPEGVDNWMYIQHIKLYNDNSQYQKQIGYDTYDDSMWVRTKSGNTWSTWKPILTSENIGSYALTSLPAHTHTIAEVTGLQTALDGKAASSHTHAASDITSGTISTDRLPKQELGISITGNFGQWQAHSAYTNFNTDVAYWGWNYVQGNTNAPHQTSSQWYRGRFSLGDQYGLGSGGGDYWMEIAIPRYSQGNNAGNLFVRTAEDGVATAWQGVRGAYSTNAGYAVSSGNSETTDQTNFTALSIDNLAVATEEFVTSQGYITGSYLPLSGGTMSGAVVVNLGNVSSDTVAFKVGGPSNYDSLTIGMEDTPDYDAFIASFGNDIRFYSGKGVGTEDHSFHWYTSKAGTAQHSVVAMRLDHNQNLTIGGTFTEQSSIRYKENVKSIPSVSQNVQQLDAVSYNKIGSNQEEIGLIAEDVAELFPEVVKYDNEGRPDGVNYSRLSVILLKAVQELTERVNKLENK